MRMPWEITDLAERRAATDVAKFPKGVASLVYQNNGKCYYCIQPVEAFSLTHPRYPTRDHKIPKARGGSNANENKVLCCFACNRTKSDMTEPEFRHFVATGTLAATYIEWLTLRALRQAKAAGVRIHTTLKE